MRQPVIVCSECNWRSWADTLGKMEEAFLHHECAGKPLKLPEPPEPPAAPTAE